MKKHVIIELQSRMGIIWTIKSLAYEPWCSVTRLHVRTPNYFLFQVTNLRPEIYQSYLRDVDSYGTASLGLSAPNCVEETFILNITE